MSGAAAGPDRVAADLVRFVVLDTETTGLDPRRDRIVTIGAVGVQGGEILLEDSFEALLRVAHNTSAVTVHGVTRDDSRHGLDEALALRLFLEYLKDGVIVGHHIQHDVQTLNAGYERHFGSQIENLCLDTMDLALHLEKDGAFAGQERIRSFSLDALCGLFAVVPHDRHTAAGDAFLTAQVFQRLLRLAARCGRTTLDRLVEPWVPDPTLD
jgi:DNA polymerase-3 subunit epsilon